MELIAFMLLTLILLVSLAAAVAGVVYLYFKMTHWREMFYESEDKLAVVHQSALDAQADKGRAQHESMQLRKEFDIIMQRPVVAMLQADQANNLIQAVVQAVSAQFQHPNKMN